MALHGHDQAPRWERPSTEPDTLSYPRVLPAEGPEIGAGDFLVAPIVDGLGAPALRIVVGVKALHPAVMRRPQRLEYLAVWFAGCDGYGASNAIPLGLPVSGSGPTAVVLDKLATDWRLEYGKLPAQFSVLGLEP